MDQKTAQRLNDLTQTAAFKIAKAMSVFDGESPEIRNQAEQIMMARVRQMRHGTNQIIDGDSLVQPAPEPETAPPVPDTA